MQRMLNLLEDDGEDYVVGRAEIYYHWRPRLAEMLKDWHGSYCTLARQYDKLKFYYIDAMNSSGSASSSSSSPDRDEQAKSQQGRCPGSAESEFEARKKTLFIMTGNELLKKYSVVQDAVKKRFKEKEKETLKSVEALVKMQGSREAEHVKRHKEDRKKIDKLAVQIRRLRERNAELKDRLQAGRKAGPRRKLEVGSWLWKLIGFIVKKFQGCAGFVKDFGLRKYPVEVKKTV
ncbi:hypothetical protein BT93_G1349 [Corymbia citriodora subsp. variegata]|nr:hypothetical protein BT93_G1349 [Corymbia citriodora subsp. variegata]